MHCPDHNPRLRRRLLVLLMFSEIAALTAVVLSHSMAVAFWLNARFLECQYGAWDLIAASIGVSVLACSLFVVQGIQYLRGHAWARRLFSLENGLLIMFGVLWFLKNQSHVDPNRDLTILGIALPLLTLLPLLWPLRNLDHSTAADQ